MLIKLFAFISLFPSFYVVNKIIKGKDLTCIDVLILFQTLYMAVIPLLGDTSQIAYKSILSDYYAQFYTFVIYNIFVWLLVLVDFIFESKYKGLYSLSWYIRRWSCSKKFNSGVLILLFLLIIFQWYLVYKTFERSVLLGVGSMESIRENVLQTNTSYNMWLFSGSHLIRLYVVFLLTVLFWDKQFSRKLSVVEKGIFWVMVILELLLHIQISRTYLFESLFWYFIIVYSYRRNYFNLTKFVRYFIVFLLSIVFLFPIITEFRNIRRVMVSQNVNVGNVIDLLSYQFKSLDNKRNVSKTADNKSSRIWNVYQIICLGVNSPYEGNGELTINAVSVGIPKFIYSGKSKTGSQMIIENVLGVHEDVADSFLLLAILENRIMAPILTLFYYFVVLFSFFGLAKVLISYLSEWLTMPLLLSSIYIWLNRVENSFDGFIPAIMQMFLWYVALYAIIKLIQLLHINLYKKKNIIRLLYFSKLR